MRFKTVQELKDFVKEWKITTHASESEAKSIYMELLEYHFDNLDYFESFVEELQSDIDEANRLEA